MQTTQSDVEYWQLAELIFYRDAGRDGVFQHHGAFVQSALAFLGK